MADGLCEWDADGPHPRNHIITTLAPFSTVELCDDHYGPGMIPLLAAELGLEPDGFYRAVEKYIASEVRKADRALADAQAKASAEGSEGPAAHDGGDHQGDEPNDDDDRAETGLFAGFHGEAE